ncbi:hypothetical protein ACHAWU_004275 [Discostella pseudostelligera]|uniref:DDE Tnp4 domain-containing protein n=1 Tax=Discostella pseudostelligera TaxID=259834 RepID=A0ABD3MCQ8_9STRA
MLLSFSYCFVENGDVDLEKFLSRRRMQMESVFNDDCKADVILETPPVPVMAISACLSDDGSIDVEKFRKRRRSQLDEWASSDYEESLDKPKKKRAKKRPILARRTETGELEEILPTQSLWYLLYVEAPNVDCMRFQHKFRRRFRMPHASFVNLVADAKAGNWFPTWMGCNCAGKKASPLELLILGALRYIGRGWTFDDLEEATAIGEDTHRRFFHQFIRVGATILFDKYVHTPRTCEEIEKHMEEFKLAGLPGACASTDATSIVHEMCSHRIQRVHKGFKTKHPTRTYNLTANHRREILCTTDGHPGSFNDKTVVLYDDFICDIKSGAIFDDYRFELLEKRGDCVVPVTYQGVWLVVDNGYHNWSITVPPFSNSSRYDEIRWSEWLESMRKDVECTFGILKGRFRILKTGIRLHKPEALLCSRVTDRRQVPNKLPNNAPPNKSSLARSPFFHFHRCWLERRDRGLVAANSGKSSFQNDICNSGITCHVILEQHSTSHSCSQLSTT